MCLCVCEWVKEGKFVSESILYRILSAQTSRPVASSPAVAGTYCYPI